MAPIIPGMSQNKRTQQRTPSKYLLNTTPKIGWMAGKQKQNNFLQTCLAPDSGGSS